MISCFSPFAQVTTCLSYEFKLKCMKHTIIRWVLIHVLSICRSEYLQIPSLQLEGARDLLVQPEVFPVCIQEVFWEVGMSQVASLSLRGVRCLWNGGTHWSTTMGVLQRQRYKYKFILNYYRDCCNCLQGQSLGLRRMPGHVTAITVLRAPQGFLPYRGSAGLWQVLGALQPPMRALSHEVKSPVFCYQIFFLCEKRLWSNILT